MALDEQATANEHRLVLDQVDVLIQDALDLIQPLTGQKRCGECGIVTRVRTNESQAFTSLFNSLDNGKLSVAACRRRLVQGYFS